MSSLLDLHLDAVPDLSIVPGGEEYQLRITAAKIKPSKSSSRDVLEVIAEINGQTNAKNIFINHAFPLPEDDERKRNNLLRNIKDLCSCFGLDPANPGNPEEWAGLEGWAVLKVGTRESGEEVNEVARYISKR